MKKFSRCVLILIVVAILSGIGAYFYENNKIKPVYESVAKLYVVPGEAFEASIRSKDGGLNDDFTIIFTGDEVINAAKELAGTTEDIKKYITVSSPENSNIVEIRCVNPSQSTAKTYVDAVAQSAVNTKIIPVESIKIFSEGTSTDKSIKPDLYKKTISITLIAVGACLLLEIIVVLFLSAFKKKDDNEAEYEYERRFGKYAYIEEIKKELLEDSEFKRASGMNSRKASDSDDILDDDDLYEDKDMKAATPSKEGEAETVKSNASSVSVSPSGVGAAVAAAQTTYSYMTDDKKEDNGPRYSAYGALIDDGKDSEESKQEEEVKSESEPEEPAAEVKEEAAEEPAAEVKEETAEEPVAEVKEETAEEPAAEVKEEAAEEPAAEVKEETAEEPVAEVKEEVAEEPAAEVKEEAAEEPVTETTEETAEVIAEQTAEQAVEEPVTETVEETVEKEAVVKKSVKIIGRICK